MDNAWDRQTDEPTLWFDRFEQFRRLGPGRTLTAVYSVYRRQRDTKKGKQVAPDATFTPARAWTVKARQFRWRERATAWDDQVVAQRRAEDARIRSKEQEDARAHRRATVGALQSIMAGYVEELATPMRQGSSSLLDPKGIRDVVSAIAVVLKESRLEFGEPTEISQLQGGDPDKPVRVQGVDSLADLFRQMSAAERIPSDDSDDDSTD